MHYSRRLNFGHHIALLVLVDVKWFAVVYHSLLKISRNVVSPDEARIIIVIIL